MIYERFRKVKIRFSCKRSELYPEDVYYNACMELLEKLKRFYEENRDNNKFVSGGRKSWLFWAIISLCLILLKTFILSFVVLFFSYVNDWLLLFICWTPSYWLRNPGYVAYIL